jgi:hypothetical protein
MRRSHVLAITLLLSSAGCHERGASVPKSGVLITHRDEREAHVGETVTVEGEISRTKLPQIAGVDVDLDESNDPRGKIARATGILRKSIVTKEELDRAIAEHGMFANRGPGTFYHLEALEGGGLARAVVLR